MNFDKNLFDDLEIRPLTKRLINNLMLDLPMEATLIVDFGIDSTDHYRALRAIVFNDADMPELAEFAEDEAVIELVLKGECHKRFQELDDAYGNGLKLNALVKKYAPEYAGNVRFETDWDEIFGCKGMGSESKE